MDTAEFSYCSTNTTSPKYICASERVKLIGSINGRFPDFGHHKEKEMGGLWLHPIKLLDGFWLRMEDVNSENVNGWLMADEYEVYPWGNIFRYKSNLGHTPVTVEQRQICPEEAAGLVVEYEFHNRGGESRSLNLEWLARTDLCPVWFSEAENIKSGGKDDGRWLDDKNVLLVKDPKNEWHTAIGGDVKPESYKIGEQFGPENTAGDGLSVSLYYKLDLKPGEYKTIRFYVAGSFASQADCLEQYRALGSGNDFYESKKERYRNLLKNTKVTTEDENFNQICDWIKIHTDWLTMDAGKYGRGLAAGMPEYPWWFGCDNCYALQGVLAMGDFKLARDTLQLLLRYSEKYNGNGRILHEVTTGGICANPGNTQETAHFIVMLWLYYEWTGDFTLIEEAFPYVQKSVSWLQGQDPEEEYFPSGYGIIEIAGLNSKMIDTAVYTAEAYRCFSKMCGIMAHETEAEKYAQLAENARDAINTKMWDESEGLYCDAFTSVQEVLEKKDAILEKSHKKYAEKAENILNTVIAEKEKQGSGRSGWLLNHNWIINTPMEMGIATQAQAERGLKTLHSSKYIGEYGMYLSGIYQDAMMTISTGVMAAAQARYGYGDRALELIEKMFKSFGKIALGCLAEMSPDYGCFVQGWTTYAAFLPIVKYFFGIQPCAGVKKDDENKLILSPSMPNKWEKAAVSDVRILDGMLTVSFFREDGTAVYKGAFTGKSPLMYRLKAGQTAVIDGKTYSAGEKEQGVSLALSGFEICEINSISD